MKIAGEIDGIFHLLLRYAPSAAIDALHTWDSVKMR